MAKWFPTLEPEHVEFIRAQRIFFVATAPPNGEGFPNLSPKGYDAIQVLGPRSLLYVDWPGSGNQTASHLEAGGRICVMFAGFEAQAQILRLYGTGTVHAPGTPAFAELEARLEPGMTGEYTRQLIEIRIEKVQTSCGYAVPRYEFVGERDTLRRYYDRAKERGELESKLETFARRQPFL